MDKKWQFVHAVEGGWWLRLTNDNDVIDYIKATNNRYDTALCKAIYNPIRKMQLKTVATYKCKGKQLQNIVMILCQKCKGY